MHDLGASFKLQVYTRAGLYPEFFWKQGYFKRPLVFFPVAAAVG